MGLSVGLGQRPSFGLDLGLSLSWRLSLPAEFEAGSEREFGLELGFELEVLREG